MTTPNTVSQCERATRRKSFAKMTQEEETRDESVEEMVVKGLCDIGRTADGLKQSFLTIDISGFGLDTVAPISKYQHLQRLKLAQNKLSTLNSLGNLNNVVYIDASDNELTGMRTTRPFRDNGIGRHD